MANRTDVRETVATVARPCLALAPAAAEQLLLPGRCPGRAASRRGQQAGKAPGGVARATRPEQLAAAARGSRGVGQQVWSALAGVGGTRTRARRADGAATRGWAYPRERPLSDSKCTRQRAVSLLLPPHARRNLVNVNDASSGALPTLALDLRSACRRSIRSSAPGWHNREAGAARA